jgi:hypothetical protein
MLHLLLFVRNLLLLHPVILQIRLLMRLGALLLSLFLSLPQMIGAFPLPNPPFTVTSTFRSPTVSYKHAVQHIHTPEHLETIAPEYFKIQRVQMPNQIGQYITIELDCLIRKQPHTLFLVTHPDQKHACTYMFLQGGNRRGEVHVEVRQDIHPYSSLGHLLCMQATHFARGGRVFSKYLQPTLDFLSRFESRSFSSPPMIPVETSTARPHPNLEWYRRMVLGMPSDRCL